MEILKLLFSILVIIVFRLMTWIQISMLAMLINFIHYFYSNQDSIVKYITELNSNINVKNSFLIMCYGIPLVIIRCGLFLINRLKMLWYIFKKTSIGAQFYSLLVMADNYIINKKNEIKSNMISMMMNNAMNGLGNMNNLNNDNSSNNQAQMPPMPFGQMPNLNDLLKNPEKMNDMMKNINNMMSNMNHSAPMNINNSNTTSSSSMSAELTLNDDNKPIMDDDLFRKINDYIDEDNSDNTELTNDQKELKSTILQTKKVNKKIRRRKKSKVNNDEFNDMKNMTVALEEVLSKLKDTK